MDLATLIGLGVGVFAVLASMVMEGGSFASLLNPSALIVIIGGTLGATAMSFGVKDVASLPQHMKQAFTGSEPDLRSLVESLVGFAELARREGLMSLENKISTVADPLLAHGLDLIASALDIEQVRSILEAEIAENMRQRSIGAEMLEAAGGYSPTMGIIGTVLGLIHVLGNISDAEKLAASIAVAFLATFYGISFANLFWLPLAGKLRLRAKQQQVALELILEGVLAIAQGVNPRLVRDKLESIAALKGEPAPPKEAPAR